MLWSKKRLRQPKRALCSGIRRQFQAEGVVTLKTERASIFPEIPNLKAKLEKLDRILPETANMKRVYDELLFEDKKVLIKEVFKGNLTYSEGAFRTPYVNEVFCDNVLKMKEKGPLFLEQPGDVLG